MDVQTQSVETCFDTNDSTGIFGEISGILVSVCMREVQRGQVKLIFEREEVLIEFLLWSFIRSKKWSLT